MGKTMGLRESQEKPTDAFGQTSKQAGLLADHPRQREKAAGVRSQLPQAGENR